MIVYADLVMLLNFLVDLLLLTAANRLAGYGGGWKRAMLAAAVGSFYAGACILPGLAFLGNVFWRLICLASISILAFGWNRSALRRGMLFSFLSMALGGLAVCLERGGFWGLALSAAALWLLCRQGFQGKTAQEFVQAELKYRDRRCRLTALRDTGNTLCDPVTGQKVLVVSADIAWDILGLTPAQLADPLGTVSAGKYPGLRLIPYRSVGRPTGMLLALKLDQVTVDGREAGKIVAFAPENFGVGNAYQALAGGVL